MKNHLWILSVGVACLAAFFAGWNISNGTGVEPGFFEAPDAGGYGAGAESAAPAGVSKELQNYYQDLTE